MSARRDSLSDDEDSLVNGASGHIHQNKSQRSYLIEELVSTQLQFALDMKQLYSAMQKVSVRLSEEDNQALFSNLKQLATVSMDLHKCWNQELLQFAKSQWDNSCIATATIPYIPQINEVFFVYCTNFDVHAVTKNPNVEAFVTEAVKRLNEDKAAAVDLNSQLIKPVQRLIKLEQLFEKLKEVTSERHPDYQHTCDLYENFRSLLRRTNEDKRWNDIRSEVFDDMRKSRRIRGHSKSLKIFDYFKPKKMPSDPRLAHEKWRLDTLLEATELVHKWINRRFEKLEESFTVEKEFLESFANAAGPDGCVSLHHRIGTCPSSCPIAVDWVSAQFVVMDSILVYMEHVTRPKLKENVLDRLQELAELLHDPNLLLDQLEKTEKECVQMEALLLSATIKNQPTNILIDRRAELKHTKETLRENLLKQLPVLIQKSEKLLLSILSYAFMLTASLLDRYGALMNQKMNRKRVSTCQEPQMTTDDFMEFVDAIAERVGVSKKLLSLASTSRAGLSKSFDFPALRSETVETLKQTVGQVLKGKCQRRVTMEYLTVPNTRHSMHPPSSANHSPRVSPSPSSSSPFVNIGFREPSTSPQPQRSRKPSYSEATHRAAYQFIARRPNELSLQSGQHVILLDDRDSTGNRDWCRVRTIPQQQTGFVPANYLQPLR